MAIGLSPRKLFVLVLIESFLIGLMGMILGGLVSVPWYQYMVSKGIDLTELMGDYDIGGVAIDPIMRMFLSPSLIAIISLVLFGLTMLAGMYPAWVAGRIPPVKSLRIV
jgi:ABC-type antimicrobial peptide transport system permease subunit